MLEKHGKLVALIVAKRTGPADDVENSVREAVGAASRRLPSYERISDYAITSDALPRTRLGKIQRHLLIERFEKAKRADEKIVEVGAMAVEEMSGEDRALLENVAAQSVGNCWRAAIGQAVDSDTSPQFDLGVDSLEWLNLTLEIAESGGVELTEEAIARIETVRDLLREVTEAVEGQGIDPLAQPYEIIDASQKRWLEPLGPVANLTARFLYAVDRVLMRGFFRLQVEGWRICRKTAGNSGPYQLSRSVRDRAVLGGATRTWAGWTGIVSANAIMVLPGWKNFAGRTDTRCSDDRAGRRHSTKEKNLVWFPEGGLAYWETATRVGGAIPVFVSGTYEAWPLGQRFPRCRPIRVLIGKPCNAHELMCEGRGKKPYEKIANALQEKVAALGLSSIRTTNLPPPER